MLRYPSRLLTASLLGIAVITMTGCGGAESRRAKHLEKGQALLVAGNFAKARVEFQNALQIAPQDAEARYEMGVVDEKLDKPREAAQFYQSAIDVNPDQLGATTRLARLYLFAGAPERAIALIEPLLVKHPDDAELLSVRAAVRVRNQDMAGAQVDAERAVQIDPANEDANALLAGLYIARGDKQKAQTLLEGAIVKIPSSIDLRLVLTQIYAQDKRLADAEALLLQIIKVKPEDKANRIRLAQFYAETNQVDAAEKTLRQAVKDLPDEFSLKLSLVDFLAARRDRGVAEKELKDMLAASPSDDQLHFALAKFYEQGNDLPKAEAVYAEVIQRRKLEAPGLTARDRLAALRYQQNDAPRALALVNEVLARSPRDDEALLLRGDIALAKQRPRDAIADLRAVLRDQPDSVAVLRSLARAHLANGEPAVAEETMRHALEASPNDPSLKLDFARLLIQLGKSPEALPILAGLIKAQPDNVDVLDTQFRGAAAANDMATAKTAAQALRSLRPDSSAGYLYGGMIAEKEKHDAEAIQLYTTAFEKEPTAEAPLQAMVHLLVSAKRTDEAVRRMEDFSKRFPDNALGPDAKGEILLSNGDIVEAKAAFNEAISRAPKWWVSYRDLAGAEMVVRNPDGAIAIMKKAEATVDQPEYASAELGRLYERAGRPEEAIAQYESILKRNPSNVAYANNLAMLLATFRHDPASYDRAKELTAPFVDSANPSFLDTYGWVLYKRGEVAASVEVLERVVAKVPDQPLARYHLGMAESLAGSSAEARDNLTQAVNSGAKFTGLEEAKATLEKIAKLSPTPATPHKT